MIDLTDVMTKAISVELGCTCHPIHIIIVAWLSGIHIDCFQDMSEFLSLRTEPVDRGYTIPASLRIPSGLFWSAERLLFRKVSFFFSLSLSLFFFFLSFPVCSNRFCLVSILVPLQLLISLSRPEWTLRFPPLWITADVKTSKRRCVHVPHDGPNIRL